MPTPLHSLPARPDPTIATNRVISNGGSPGVLQETGTFRGERVQPVPTDGMALDSVEEVSMHFSERVEEDEIKEERPEADRDPVALTATEVVDYLDRAHLGPDAERMVMLAKLMQEPGSNPGGLAQSSFPDATRQHLVLQFALGQAQRKLELAAGQVPLEAEARQVVEALREAIGDLDEDAGPTIRANLNTIEVATTAGPDAKAVAAFQATYVDVVLGKATLAQTLQQALTRFGAAGFEKGLKNLMAAIGLDLAATMPSTGRVRLQTLSQDLYQLQVVNTVLGGALALSNRLQRQLGAKGFAPDALVRDLVTMTGERWVSPDRFTGLARQYVDAFLAAQATFLVGVRGLLGGLPVAVFSDKEARERALESAQVALDEVAEREEDEKERQRQEQPGDDADADADDKSDKNDICDSKEDKR